MSAHSLQTAAIHLGYSLHVSPAAPDTDRRLIFFYRTAEVPVVTDFCPGYGQLITFANFSIVHIHAPAGTNNKAPRDAFFRNDVVQVTAASTSPSILMGDFNCLLSPGDTEANFQDKQSPALAAVIESGHYTDAFLKLHPHAPPSFTFHRRGCAQSRLDRAYLPPALSPLLMSASHVTSLSDHSALFLTLKTVVKKASPPPRQCSHHRTLFHHLQKCGQTCWQPGPMVFAWQIGGRNLANLHAEPTV